MPLHFGAHHPRHLIGEATGLGFRDLGDDFIMDEKHRTNPVQRRTPRVSALTDGVESCFRAVRNETLKKPVTSVGVPEATSNPTAHELRHRASGVGNLRTNPKVCRHFGDSGEPLRPKVVGLVVGEGDAIPPGVRHERPRPEAAGKTEVCNFRQLPAQAHRRILGDVPSMNLGGRQDHPLGRCNLGGDGRVHVGPGVDPPGQGVA